MCLLSSHLRGLPAGRTSRSLRAPIIRQAQPGAKVAGTSYAGGIALIGGGTGIRAR